MSAEMITELFSHICGQSRSFVADGMLLPVDQRCLGLYVGAFLTAVWLASTGIWRHGLPGRGVVVLHVALLVLAILGGRHVIDPGPLWRFVCGLWTGHVVLLWLIGSAVDFTYLSRPTGQAEPEWRAVQSAHSAAFPLLLAVLAWVFPALLPLGWVFWTTAAILGVCAIAVGLALATLTLVRFGLRASSAA
jgi:uncharacterized membrane protein